MPAIDVFKNDAFSMITLTEAVNKMPHIPGRVGRIKLFQPRGVPTTSVMFEEKDGILYLVNTQPRGAPGQQNQTGKRTARTFKIPHMAVSDRVLADEIQDVRAFGSQNELAGVEMVVNDRMKTMTLSLDATLEHLRMGAVKGIILDADGSTEIYNLFTEFGVSQHAEIDFDLDNAAPASGAVRKKCTQVDRLISGELGALAHNGVHCLCGDNFWDDLTAHSEIRETYLNQQAAAQLREGIAYEVIRYGGITFENYRGKVGSVEFIDTDKAHFFPVGVPGLFIENFAPADYMETANTIGLPRYAKIAPDASFQKWVDLEVQSNPLPICTRPKVLIKAKRT